MRDNPTLGAYYNSGEDSKLLCPSFVKNKPETGIDIPEHEYNTANKVNMLKRK